jgi:ABC-type transport system involved in cytochrome c biogenesis permease subunit
MDLNYLELITLLAALGGYGVLSVIVIRGITPRWLYLTLSTGIIILQGFSIGIRWASTGHPPILGTFEEALAASWFLVVFVVIVDRSRQLAPIIIPLSFLTLIYGLRFDTLGRPLIISEQSYWVYFHALFAWIAYSFYTISFAASLGVLFGRYARRFFSDEELFKRYMYNGLLYGFAAQTVMFVLGSYYSSRLHGSWWTWDPVEYLFVVSWIVYAIAIHGRVFYKWEEKRLARWVILGMAGTILLYWVLNYFPWATYHIFDIEQKQHILPW